MSKSLDFIYDKIQEGQLSAKIPLRTNGILEFNPYEFLSSYAKNQEIKYGDCNIVTESFYLGKQRELHSSIHYEPEADFDYCVTNGSINDGTIVFMINGALEVFEKVWEGRTYCALNAPEDFLENRWKYKINYVIGNLIILNNVEENPEKPWAEFRTMALLPTRVEYEVIDNA